MKTFFTGTSLALLLLLGTFIPFTAQAEESIPATQGANAEASSIGPQTGVSGTEDAAKLSAANKPTSPPTYVPDTEYGWVMEKIMRLAAWLLGMAAITLDNAVYYTVVQMGSILGGASGLSAIGVTWSVLRDIGNIILIFGFIALGITTILQVDWYGGGAKMIPKLLMAAVLINFSLFISEAVIDGGNLFATQFYTQINAGQQPGPMTYGQVDQEGISNAIMSKLGLQDIYGSALTPNTKIFEAGNVWIVGAFGTLLFLIASFVFFSLAFILIARFVILTLLIIVAPIGFAGLAVPKLKGLADQWWQMLIKQTLTAPVLLLLLYVALNVITDASFLTGFGVPDSAGVQSTWLGWLGENTGVGLASTAGMLLSFFIAMGLLLAVTMTANKMSAFGAGMATKAAGTLTFGAIAFGARNSVGWGSQRFGQKLQKSRVGRIPVLGRGLAGALSYGANGSFDVRGTNMLKPTGLNAGTAQKGGFAGDEKKAIEAREKYAKSLEHTDEEKELIKTEEGRKKGSEEMIGLIKTQNDEERREQQVKHADELRPFVGAVNLAQQALNQAKRAGTGYEVAEAQRNLTSATNEQEVQRKTHAQEQAKLKEVHREMLDVQQKEVDVHKENLQKYQSAPQAGYAKGLTWGPGALRYRNTKAAANIVKNATKDKDQKNVDSFMDVLKKNSTGGGKP